MNPIPPEAFFGILAELQRKPLVVNNYRIKTGAGRSQAFGVVNKRCQPIDYSRQCWLRPYLYYLLLEFGKKYVTDISWNAITVNQNYSAGPHYDRGNDGPSFLVAAGDYEGGALKILEGDLSGCHDIKYRPLVTDFSKCLHAVEPWTGNRVSLVFYKLRNTPPDLPPPSVIFKDGEYRFKRGNKIINGLPHPLRKRPVVAIEDLEIDFC